MTEHTLDENVATDGEVIIEKPHNPFITSIVRPKEAWPYIIHKSPVNHSTLLLALYGFLTALQSAAMLLFSPLGISSGVLIGQLLGIFVGSVVMIILGNMIYAWMMRQYESLTKGKTTTGQFYRILAWGTLTNVLVFPINTAFVILTINGVDGSFSWSELARGVVDVPMQLANALISAGFAVWGFIRVIQGIQTVQQRGIGSAIATYFVPGILVLIIVIGFVQVFLTPILPF